ncbi:MAG: peptidoglycan DD-metalloendopeptidase family protein, partial [Candidatus Paceibacterota bacterium]
FLLGLVLAPGLFLSSGFVFAQSEADKLRSQKDQLSGQLADIEKEIAAFEAELNKVGAEKNTLQKAINQLELERSKVLADVRYTENRISTTDMQIGQLNTEIVVTSDGIDSNMSAVAEILRAVDQNDSESLVELLLRYDNLSDFWIQIEDLETIRKSMREKVQELNSLRGVLEEKVLEETGRRADLVSLRQQYSGQQAVLDGNRREQTQLLTATKNEEAEYQKMLADRKAAREKMVKQVQDVESQLKFILDPNSIPTKGTAVFRWPLEKIVLTQYFGYTKFALENTGIYKNNMHNGIDLGAAVGTKIYAPLTGTVRATANTDLVPGCYSWGQWVLVDHPNGLSTLYAHLSWTGVSAGQKLATGDLIGYVGATGYATGPHLHFTLYVSAAVGVKRFNEFKAVTGCGAALSPFSAVEGYLNPLDYLPSP